MEGISKYDPKSIEVMSGLVVWKRREERSNCYLQLEIGKARQTGTRCHHFPSIPSERGMIAVFLNNGTCYKLREIRIEPTNLKRRKREAREYR